MILLTVRARQPHSGLRRAGSAVAGSHTSGRLYLLEVTLVGSCVKDEHWPDYATLVVRDSD
jgi:hypothetical protein